MPELAGLNDSRASVFFPRLVMRIRGNICVLIIHMFVWPGCQTHCLSVEVGLHLLHQEVNILSLFSTFTFAFFLCFLWVFLVFLLDILAIILSLLASFSETHLFDDRPVPLCAHFPVPLVKDFLSLVLFIPTVSLSLTPSLTALLFPSPPPSSLPQPSHPRVPLCSHGPCMWHEAKPKHPGCPLQPSTVPGLVKF